MKDTKEYIWKTRLVYIREVTINPSVGGWMCNLAICGARDLQTLFHRETDSDETFQTPIEAEVSALERAKKWVDEFQNEIYKVQN